MESTCKAKQNIMSVRAFSQINMFNHITPFTVTVPLILLSPSFGINIITYEEPLWGFCYSLCVLSFIELEPAESVMVHLIKGTKVMPFINQALESCAARQY